MTARRSLLLVAALPLLGCAPRSTDRAPESPGRPTASPTPQVHVPPSSDPAPAAFASSSSAAPPAPVQPSTSLAASAAATTTDPLTPADREVLAMCQGKKDLFTDKELKLLRLADASPNTTLHEHAAAIRTRRRQQVNEACDRLRESGKM